LVIGAWRSVWRYQGGLASGPASPAAPPRSLAELRRKHRRDRRLNRLRRSARIGCLTDRPADDDVVGAVGKRLGHVDRALLVAVVDSAPGGFRRDDQQPCAELAPQAGSSPRKQPRRSPPRAPAASREHQSFNVAFESPIVEIALVEAGEHGHRGGS